MLRMAAAQFQSKRRIEMGYGIWCEVWGGVTGRRGAWLKVEGQIQVYPTLQEALAIAADIQNRCNPNGATNYSYQAREFTA
jgi:hypothetical protein